MVKSHHSNHAYVAFRRTLAFLAGVMCITFMLGSGDVMAGQKSIVYIEASTVNHWKLGDFDRRVHNDDYKIKTMTLYDFDKTPRVDSALGEKPKPNVVIVQECSTYFPGDLQVYKRKYQSWIQQIRKAGVVPVIATTVTPAASHGFTEDLKEFIKVKILGRESQYDQIVEFNKWLRQLAKQDNVTLFDLEKYTRISDTDRHMLEEYDSGDGTHPNAVAYQMLDKELLSMLKGLK